MPDRLDEFSTYRQQMNARIAQIDHLGIKRFFNLDTQAYNCLLYTSPSPRDRTRPRMPSSA